jgi:hypothetical protein
MKIDAGLLDRAGCCKAAFDLGGVAYFQWVLDDDFGCRVWRIANNNTCVQSAANFTGELTTFPNTLADYTGNGVCGQITDTVYVAPS